MIRARFRPLGEITLGGSGFLVSAVTMNSVEHDTTLERRALTYIPYAC